MKFIFALIALAIASPLDFVPVEGTEFQIASLRSAFSDTITDCKIGKADFKPLKKNDGDHLLEYKGAAGICQIHINFCQQTERVCRESNGIYIISIKGRDFCVVYTDTWENSTGEETTYRGQYAVKINSEKEDYHLTMVKNLSPLVYLMLEPTKTMVNLILGSKFTSP